MSDVLMVLVKAIPLVLMILVGVVLKNLRFFRESTLADMKKLIVNISLPATLFITFANTDFHRQYVALIAIVFVFCAVMLFVGDRVGRSVLPDNPVYPALYSGFEAGMMGYALFASFFAREELFKFAVIDIGQVVFVFLVMTFYLQKKTGSKTAVKKLMKSFAISPVILAIFFGVFMSASGGYRWVTKFSAFEGVKSTLEILGAMTQPLICIVIGYELRMRAENFKVTLLTILARMSVMIAAAYLISHFVIQQLLGLDRMFSVALFTLFILPPPFVIPIYVSKAGERQKSLISDILSVHVIFSLLAFIILLMIY